MDTSEEKVERYLTKRGFRLERFSKAECRKGKTPDFRVFKDKEFAFFCEVKSVIPDNWLGGSRSDPTYNRLTSDIEYAVKQFGAVNPDQEYPNVMAIVNQDIRTGFLDLIAVTTGNFVSVSGEMHPIYRKFSEGRIKEKKNQIHLFIWLDDHQADQLYFNLAAGDHLQRLCRHFGVDAASI